MIIDLSIVIPCLNETETLEYCIKQARSALESSPGINVELILANNGGEDQCYKIGLELADKVVLVEERGYGAALREGIRNASGKYIIFADADADASYDFFEVINFYNKLNEGYDLVVGCRLKAGRGEIKDQAMPFLHKWIGNPLFSKLAKFLFKIPINDIHCGMRAIRKDFYDQLDLKSVGMEFASEMIIKANRLSEKITEIPITLYKDKRINTRSHLRTFRDGFRHLAFFLSSLS